MGLYVGSQRKALYIGSRKVKITFQREKTVFLYIDIPGRDYTYDYSLWAKNSNNETKQLSGSVSTNALLRIKVPGDTQEITYLETYSPTQQSDLPVYNNLSVSTDNQNWTEYGTFREIYSSSTYAIGAVSPLQSYSINQLVYFKLG